MVKCMAALLLAPAMLGAGRDLVVFDTDSGLFGDDGAALVVLEASVVLEPADDAGNRVAHLSVLVTAGSPRVPYRPNKARLRAR